MRTRLALLTAAVLGLGCEPPPCEAATTMCGCFQRRDECVMVTDSCWCPDECGVDVKCFCGGGAFLRCEARP
ncbi:MAG: hypothetical protein Q8L48_18065 [Archangium sp.]|nr:hypothetical protein [Archangium sp.]